MDLSKLHITEQQKAVKTQIQTINGSLIHHNGLYQRSFESDMWYERQDAFKNIIKLYKDFILNESRKLTYQEFKELKLDMIYDALTMVYIEVENGVYCPLEIINGKITV